MTSIINIIRKFVGILVCCIFIFSTSIPAQEMNFRKSFLAPNSWFTKKSTVIFKPMRFNSNKIISDTHRIREQINLYIGYRLEFLGYTGFDVGDMNAAIFEGLKNAAGHGNDYNKDKQVIMKAKLIDDILLISITDSGGKIFDHYKYSIRNSIGWYLRVAKGLLTVPYNIFMAMLIWNLDSEEDGKKLLSGKSYGIYKMSRYFNISYRFLPEQETVLYLSKKMIPPVDIKIDRISPQRKWFLKFINFSA